MTIIKQTAVSSDTHVKNLRAYINDDTKVLLRSQQNLKDTYDLKNWASQMQRTQKRCKHTSARKHRDKETGELVESKNTTMYHQILAFLPEECDMNGGTLTPQKCLDYAQQYVQTYYPDLEIVMALHNEYCAADGTNRYAMHMVINRTNLDTGKRLNEGRGQQAKRNRAKRIRNLDASWNLQQVKKDEQNSKIHKRQPSKIEKELIKRKAHSYKRMLRRTCIDVASKSLDIVDFCERLEQQNIRTEIKNNKLYVEDKNNTGIKFSLSKLASELTNINLISTFEQNKKLKSVEQQARVQTVTASVSERTESKTATKDVAPKQKTQTTKTVQTPEGYIAEVKQQYACWKSEVKQFKGKPKAEIPKFKMPKANDDVLANIDVKLLRLNCKRGSDALREKLCAEHKNNIAQNKKRKIMQARRARNNRAWLGTDDAAQANDNQEQASVQTQTQEQANDYRNDDER